MINSSGVLSIELQSQKRKTTLTVVITLMGMFLHQTSGILGINASLADIFCVMVFFILLIQDKLVFPVKHTLFFILLSVVLLINSMFVVPMTISYYPELTSIITNYLKLLMVFIYFIIGYCIARQSMFDYVLKWYSYFGLTVGCLGIIMTLTNIGLFNDVFFLWGRFKGLMNDPNYYAILQVTALAIAIRRISNNKYKPVIWILVFLSVSISGSKTGMITFIVYLIFYCFESIIRKKKRLHEAILFCIVLAIIFLLTPYFVTLINYTIDKISTFIPIFSRVEVLFNDYMSAISNKESSRDAAWGNAINLIAMSPILGIGIGTYGGIAEMMFGSKTIAHNTYLQLGVEWGVPLIFLFFAYVFYLLGRTSFSKYEEFHETSIIIRDVLIVLLIGSFAISLNNARIFWLFLGALIFYVNQHKSKNVL